MNIIETTAEKLIDLINSTPSTVYLNTKDEVTILKDIYEDWIKEQETFILIIHQHKAKKDIVVAKKRTGEIYLIASTPDFEQALDEVLSKGINQIH